MAKPRYILALDQGTTSSRAIVFDHDGRRVALAQKELTQSYPQPGWVEHDPLEIWSSQSATAAEAAGEGQSAGRCRGGRRITNQRETTMAWERASGRPVYPAIVWQDRRTADECARLKREGAEPMVTAKTGLRLDPYFSGTKLGWILDHVAGARGPSRGGKALLRHRGQLVGLATHRRQNPCHGCDERFRTLLCNIHTGEWGRGDAPSLARAAGDAAADCSSSEVYGEVAANLQPAGVPIAGIAGDQQAALSGRPASARAWPRTPMARVASC